MAGTEVIYNGVTLHNVHTREWDEEVVYDESGTDPIGVKYRLTFDCVCHQESVPIYNSPVYMSDGPAGHPSNVHRLISITRKLEQPRKQLQILFEGEQVLRIDPLSSDVQLNGQTTDTNNGPRPTKVSVFNIAGDKSFRVRFSIEASTLNCESLKTGQQAMVLSNRWGIRETMDENFKISRSITGALRLAGSASRTGMTLSPHAYRYLCFPGLEDGFRRKSVSFQTDISGNKLNYEIVDEQSRYAPPWPATRMNGRHSCGTQDGFTFINECQVRLTGPPHCDIRDLMRRALQVCQYRLNYENVGVGEDNGSRILDATITEMIGDEPTIDVSIRVQELAQTVNGRLNLLHTRYDRMGQMVLPKPQRLNTRGKLEDLKAAPYRINRHPVPGAYGTDEYGTERNGLTLALLKCVLQSQCESAQSLESPAPQPEKQPPKQYPDRVEQPSVYQSPSTSDLSDPSIRGTWPDEHLNAMYVSVAESMKIVNDRPMVRLPVANSSIARQPTSSIVALSTGMSAKIVTVDFERIGKQPQLPAWKAHQIPNGGPYFVPTLLSFEILSPRFTANADQLLYRARAEYLYYGDRELRLDAIIPIGRLPIMGEKVAVDTVNLGEVFDRSS